jgi:acyl carrier protein
MQHGQFLCYQAGEMLASAVLLAAARGHGSCEATTWAAARYTRAVQAVRASSHSTAVYSGNQLASVVAGYAAAIGDVEPTLPGEETDLDPLLLRDAAAPVATPPEDAPRNDSMLRLVHDIVLARLQEQGIVSDDTPLDHDMSFSALGLDSLLLMRIGLDVQNVTGQVLSPELAYEYSSIRELARYLERSRTLPQ